MNNPLHTTVVLAMTADGKISDYQSSAARFGSGRDRSHLEQQVSLADGVLFGAGTLRAYGTTLTVKDPILLQERIERSQSPQPVQIVVSASANLNSQWRFFQQPGSRWLLTTDKSSFWQKDRSCFERVLSCSAKGDPSIDWSKAFIQFKKLGIDKLAIRGGAELVASLLAVDLVDELWLTICPLILGGQAPTPVGGMGWLQSQAKQLKLLEVKQIEEEVFLHYQVIK